MRSWLLAICLCPAAGSLCNLAAQDGVVKPASGDAADDNQQVHGDGSVIAVRTLEFKAVDSPPNLPDTSVTTFPSECTSDGSLFLDMLDPKEMNQHTVMSIRGKYARTFQTSAISDLHDIFVMSVFPSDDTVGFLVRGSKETPGPRGSGKSRAGIGWKDYHNFIAEFDRNGQYQRSIQLPVDYSLSHFAILSSGQYLVTGYDKLNSTVRLLLLNSSGEVLRSLDMPSAREFASKNVPENGLGDTVGADQAGRQMLGSILFTPYGQDILVWRMNSSLPLLDVGPGGSVREVPIQPPAGEVFVDMVPASDRWVAHFRSQAAPENGVLHRVTDSYYELNSQDGSVSAKLAESGDAPASISCESGGKYIAFKKDLNNKLVMLAAE